MKYVKNVFMMIVFLFSFLFAQQNEILTFNLKEPIVVTASRIPTPLMRTARTVVVLDSAFIARLPVHSVQEALEYIAGVDVQQRGSQGVQGDVSLRGSTYEQVLILVDGVKVTDPQTGHHNLNLPVSLQAIDRIEVLKGAGSRLYGPNAMSGIINIITKPARSRHLDVSLVGGDFGYKEGAVNLDFRTLSVNHSLSLSSASSNGYRYNTNFMNYTMSYKNRVQFKKSSFNVMAGYNTKDFGANRFYHPSYPSQKEKTEVFYFTTAARLTGASSTAVLLPKVYWRHHTDDFLLDYTRPDWYHNHHKTNLTGAEILTNFSNRFGNTALQIEWMWSEIKSNNLGSHQRTQFGLSTEHQLTWHLWQIVLGSTFYRYNNWGWQICPGLDMSYQLTPNVTIYASGGKAFRPPSFTEMYYFSAANRGNPNLRPEQSLDIEFGTRVQTANSFSSLALFRRNGTNLIDWIYEDGGKFWQAMNITNMVTNGLEFAFQYHLAQKIIKNLSLNYSYLTADKTSHGFTSKYVLNYLHHQLIIGIDHQLLLPNLLFNWKMRYEDRLNTGEQFIADVRVQWQVEKFRFLVDVSNIFNRKYEDFTAIPQPGRWFKIGIKYFAF